jgi:hypothetical protein
VVVRGYVLRCFGSVCFTDFDSFGFILICACEDTSCAVNQLRARQARTTTQFCRKHDPHIVLCSKKCLGNEMLYLRACILCSGLFFLRFLRNSVGTKECLQC